MGRRFDYEVWFHQEIDGADDARAIPCTSKAEAVATAKRVLKHGGVHAVRVMRCPARRWEVVWRARTADGGSGEHE